MSSPFVTRLVPTRTSIAPFVNASTTRSRGVATLHDVPVEAADAQVREPGPDLGLHALGPAAEVADPG